MPSDYIEWHGSGQARPPPIEPLLPSHGSAHGVPPTQGGLASWECKHRQGPFGRKCDLTSSVSTRILCLEQPVRAMNDSRRGSAPLGGSNYPDFDLTPGFSSARGPRPLLYRTCLSLRCETDDRPRGSAVPIAVRPSAPVIPTSRTRDSRPHPFSLPSASALLILIVLFHYTLPCLEDD